MTREDLADQLAATGSTQTASKRCVTVPEVRDDVPENSQIVFAAMMIGDDLTHDRVEPGVDSSGSTSFKHRSARGSGGVQHR